LQEDLLEDFWRKSSQGRQDALLVSKTFLELSTMALEFHHTSFQSFQFLVHFIEGLLGEANGLLDKDPIALARGDRRMKQGCRKPFRAELGHSRLGHVKPILLGKIKENNVPKTSLPTEEAQTEEVKCPGH
jgi:hypothetical protein